jgi:hypothetical protein
MNQRFSNAIMFFIYSDHENFYDGRLFGEVSSEASVHLEDGLMTASIHTPEEIYHIEVIILHVCNSCWPCFLMSTSCA